MLLALLCGGCGFDRQVGTTGTEAGNAFTARIVRADGSPAIGALALARPSESLADSNWPSAVADDQGRVRLELSAARAWTIEFSQAGTEGMARLEAKSIWDEAVVALRPAGAVTGRVVGGVPGDRLYLPGLGRSTTLDAQRMFGFSGLPAQGLSVRHAGTGMVWGLEIFSEVVRQVVLDLQSATASYGDPVVVVKLPGQTIAKGALVPLDVPDPVPGDAAIQWSGYRLVDPAGGVVPMWVERRDSATGLSRLWIRAGNSRLDSAQHLLVVAALPNTPMLSPFATGDLGLATLLAPASVDDLAPPTQLANLALAGTVVQGVHALARLAPDPVFAGAWSLSASYGPDLVALDSSVFPGKSPRAISMRFRLLDPRIGRLWLIHAADSSLSRTLRVAWGGDSLVLEAFGGRMAKFVACDDGAHTLTLSPSDTGWVVYFDGVQILSAAAGPDFAATDYGSLRAVVGRGAGVALKELFVFGAGVDAAQAALLAR